MQGVVINMSQPKMRCCEGSPSYKDSFLVQMVYLLLVLVRGTQSTSRVIIRHH